MDAGALAGGTLLPVDGSNANGNTGTANVAAIRDRIIKSVNATYPGLVEGVDYKIDLPMSDRRGPATGAPLISRDIPIVCDPDPRARAQRRAPATSSAPDRRATRPAVRTSGTSATSSQINGAINTQFSFGARRRRRTADQPAPSRRRRATAPAGNRRSSRSTSSSSSTGQAAWTATKRNLRDAAVRPS